MTLPDTDNVHFQHAFKKGYRLALEGKSLMNLPSEVRRDLELRQYFQQGWEQAQQDLAINLQTIHQPNWRARLGWFIILMLGGISTGALMVHNAETEKAQKPSLVSKETSNASQALAHAKPIQLSLLTIEQRDDLSADLKSQQQNAYLTAPLQPLLTNTLSTFNVTSYQLSAPHKELSSAPTIQQSFDQHVPKHIRLLHFTATLLQPTESKQTVYLRWRFNEKIINTSAFDLTNPQTTIASQQPLSNAWLGTWHVEILNAEKAAIFRHTFQFGNVL
ncbi:DUF2914 domain-containing protein [Thiomicrorhabdus aquaedulcis]|uniref:DUF2914 domain-containing protein n=1 Tax=Thiomicrorhabdus aquaedulcis TaxID=2211106 RepID=UPI000FD97B37|nr:DUF2914 domain-containing protein [Thiomicrorhabdus aquaedulcis]